MQRADAFVHVSERLRARACSHLGGRKNSMLQGLCRREPGRFGAPPRWLRSERAATWAALTVAALGFGLSVLIALFGR
jgi:hypothetical protein